MFGVAALVLGSGPLADEIMEGDTVALDTRHAPFFLPVPSQPVALRSLVLPSTPAIAGAMSVERVTEAPPPETRSRS